MRKLATSRVLAGPSVAISGGYRACDSSYGGAASHKRQRRFRQKVKHGGQGRREMKSVTVAARDGGLAKR